MKYLVIASLALCAFGCKKDDAAADADTDVAVAVDGAVETAQDATPVAAPADDATVAVAVDVTVAAD